jgi:peroxiredoxin
MSETLTVPQVGDLIADIPIRRPDGSVSSLRTEIAGDAAVVFFMRAADCPICLAHSRTLARMATSGDLGAARAFVIAPGPASEARKAEGRIASDAVDVWASGDHHADLGLGRFLMLQHSGTFVVGAGGQILDAVTSALPTASFSKGRIIAALAADHRG